MGDPFANDASYVTVPLGHQRLAPEESLARSRAFLDTMRRRRSVRAFSTEPVPFALIEAAVAAAGTAPSGANQQPWTFVAVGDPDLKARMRAAAEGEERDFYTDHITPEWRAALAPLGTDPVKTHLTDAPWVVVVFAHAFGLERLPDGGERQFKHYYVAESVGIAVGLFLASLTHAGLVALTHTPSPMAFLGALLDRPRNERAYVVIPVGYPAPDATVPAHALEKKSLEQILIQATSR
ncbi:MAG: Nitroreductase family protein [uncultured Thermomicrobiales bacterium]|uniref:Nitroreductase family protein n=1 Tax=uncultured Thermomicrobiales bacterium TaxID=1645740 RepID=A0A6J4VCD8_9BACT|nr:MAG: Nitroreductase family protein [uncultured Thermomicrobiales bacterium]